MLTFRPLRTDLRMCLLAQLLTALSETSETIPTIATISCFSFLGNCCRLVTCVHIASKPGLAALCASSEEKEGFYKCLPANTADRLWQSLSNPAKRHSFVSN